jgi:ADP-ribosylglycohydrolase
VLWSLYAFLRSPDDYWETICTAVSVGGDTDSMAAMAGAISGARVGRDGLPKDLVARVNDRGEWDAAALTTLAEECAALVDDG